MMEEITAEQMVYDWACESGLRERFEQVRSLTVVEQFFRHGGDSEGDWYPWRCGGSGYSGYAVGLSVADAILRLVPGANTAAAIYKNGDFRFPVKNVTISGSGGQWEIVWLCNLDRKGGELLSEYRWVLK